jgi:hypothetical protein
MQQSVIVKLVAAIVGVGLLAGAIALFYTTQPARVVAFGQPIRQDDFLYTVVGVAKAKSLSDGIGHVQAQGLFYVATVEVANKALRVDYRWDPAIVYVVDAAGHQYRFSLDGQRALDVSSARSPIVAPGATTRFQVAFDLPRQIDKPALAFSHGILMGDVFDGAAYTRARVPLE